MARILIAEDDFHLRSLIGEILGKVGHITYPVENGRQALEVLKCFPIDLIVSDILMPDIGGLQLLEQSKKRYPAVPVVIMSVYSGSSLVKDALRKGAACYLLKPFTYEQLITVVEDLVASKQRVLETASV